MLENKQSSKPLFRVDLSVEIHRLTVTKKLVTIMTSKEVHEVSQTSFPEEQRQLQKHLKHITKTEVEIMSSLNQK